MRPGQATHEATIEHLTETDEETDDGMGGTTPITDWVSVVDSIPVRYLPDGVGVERESHGAVFRDSPSLVAQAKHVGEIDTDGRYSLFIGSGDEWRVLVPGLTQSDARRSLMNHELIMGRHRIPDAVHLELETLTE